MVGGVCVYYYDVLIIKITFFFEEYSLRLMMLLYVFSHHTLLYDLVNAEGFLVYRGVVVLVIVSTVLLVVAIVTRTQ